MEEKVLAKSKRYNLKLLRILPLVIILVYIVIFLIQFIPTYIELVQPCYLHPSMHALWECSTRYWFLESYEMPSSPLKATLREIPFGSLYNIKMILATEIIPMFLVWGIIYFWLSKYSLVVTDKRIYGQTAFGRRVDLPVDTISSVGMSMFNGIAVGTSSGRVGFLLIKNRDELHAVISNLIIERQTQITSNAAPTIQQIVQSDADELKKYKALLDDGIITQEEFNAKKKEILGL